MILAATIILASRTSFAVTQAASAQPFSFSGFYEGVQFDKGKRIDNATRPIAYTFVLNLKKDGSFLLVAGISGWNGKWTSSGKKIKLTMTEDPAGKMAKPQKSILLAKPDRRKLVFIAPKQLVGAIEFRWNPQIRKQLQERFKQTKGQ